LPEIGRLAVVMASTACCEPGGAAMPGITTFSLL
jgi:hypothetical protein